MKNNFFAGLPSGLFAACLFLFTAANAQQQWANYTFDGLGGEVTFEGDDVWVPTQGGLVKINRVSGAKQVYLPCNSGLKSAPVADVLVDTGGVKWIGSEQGGLQRYDGTNWTQYSLVNTGDTLIYVQDLNKDTQGRLWFISRVNGNCNGCNKLMYLENGQFHKVPNAPGGGTAAYYKFLSPDQAGNMWAVASFTVAQIQSDTSFVLFDAIDMHLGAKESVTNIGVDRTHGHVYITTFEYVSGSAVDIYRLRRFDGVNWEEVVLPLDIKLGYGRSFQNDPEGNFWILVDNYNTYKSALLRFDGTSWTQYSTTDLGLTEDFMNGATIDTQGHIWTAIHNNDGKNDLLERQDTIWKKYDTGIFPVRSNYYEHAAFDKKGHAWLMDGGLTEFDGLTWKHYTTSDFGGPTNMGFSCLAIDTATGTFWFGLANDQYKSAVLKHDGAHSTIYPLPDYYDVDKIIPLANGKAWAASDKGLGFFDGVQWTWFDENNSSLPNNYIYDIALDLSGNIWASVWPGQIVRFDGTNWTIFGSMGSSSWLFCDRAGQIWTGGTGGLRRFDGNGWVTVPVPEVPANQAAYHLVQDFDLSYWLYGFKTMWHWDGATTWQPFSIYNAPLTSSYYPYDIQIDPFGNKWFLSSTGISVYNADGISNQFVNPKSTIQGTVFFDADQNGQQDALGEPGIPGAQVLMLPDSIRSLSIAQGLYSFFPAPGPHQIEYAPKPGYEQTSDSTQYHVLAGLANQSGFDFGAWTADVPDSLRLDLVAGALRCHTQGAFWLHLTNLGLEDASGQISFTHDPALSFSSSEPPPASINGNTLTWNYENLAFFATHSIKLRFEALGVGQIGDTLSHSALATQNGSAASASDELQTIVRCGYDPNDKLVEPTGPSQGVRSLIENPLRYTVRFQNTGNDTAFTVVIRDTLDAAFDVSSLEIISSSHSVRAQVEPGGAVTFVFDHINLLWQKVDELGSQGYVSYQVRARKNVADGILALNTARIYFDLNPAIVTNTTSNILVEKLFTSSTQDAFGSTVRILVTPNPMSEEARFEVLGLSEHLGNFRLQVFDLQGNVVRDLSASTPVFVLKKESLPAGMYFFRVLEEGKLVGSGKLIRAE